MLIGEVARHTGVSTRMLRHYDALDVVSPTGRTAGGYRTYAPADLQRLMHIECLRSLGLGLGDVRRALDDPDFDAADVVARLLAETRERIAREHELLERLTEVEATASQDWHAVMRVVALLRGIRSASPSERQRSALKAGGLPADTLVAATLDEDEPNVAGALRWAVARSGSDAVPALREALRAADARSRRGAVETLAKISSDAATAALRSALADPDIQTRGRAAAAIGRRGEAAAIPVLVEMVVRGERDVECAEVLGTLAGSGAHAEAIVTALHTELQRDGAPAQARLRVVQALAELPSAAASEVLQQLSSDRDAQVTRIAAYALMREKDAGAAGGVSAQRPTTRARGGR